MSIKEELDDSSWVTFVSPLVRIVERKENSLSPPSTSSVEQHLSNKSKSSVSPNIPGAASSETVSSGSGNYFELPIDLSSESQDMGNLPSGGLWELDETGLPADIFGPVMDMESHSWQQSR